MTSRTIVLGAALMALLAGCATTPTQQGAVGGGALGAGAGAIIGNQVGGRTGEGALVGGAIGALTGALVGDRIDEERGKARTQTVQAAPAPAPARTVRGHYENRIVTTQSGETYEERVWVPDK